MSSVCCTASASPDLYRLASEIAAVTNPACHWDLRQLDPAMQRAMLDDLLIQMAWQMEAERVAQAFYITQRGSG